MSQVVSPNHQGNNYINVLIKAKDITESPAVYNSLNKLSNKFFKIIWKLYSPYLGHPCLVQHNFENLATENLQMYS